MGNRLDEAIWRYTQDPKDDSLQALHKLFILENLCVPISQVVQELKPHHYDVPVICIRNEKGAGAIPAFTSTEHLYEWKPHGCLYTSLTGRALLAMAINMQVIAEILVNPYSVPRGRIPRVDFERLLALK